MDDSRIIMHIDVNSAYLSWEAAYRLQHGATLDLRAIPSVVGGDEASRHGIVLAKSIPAKQYQVHTGEALYAVRQRCPGIVVVPPHYDLYMMSSAALLNLLEEYTPKIQVFSIDECFIDFSHMERLYSDPVEAAHLIKERIKSELGFTVNIGISSSKLLAKIAGDLEKPDKVHTLFPKEIPEKMWPLPVEDLYMVGRATAPKLHKLNIHTIGDLAHTDIALLLSKFKSWGRLLWEFANGIESSGVGEGSIPVKGIGNSTTISFDVDTREEAHRVLLSLTEMVCMRLRRAGFCAQLVAVSLRTNEFIHFGRQRKFAMATDCTADIYNYACILFDEIWRGQPIRHLGVRVSELCGSDYLQLSLLQPYNEKKKRLDSALDEIRIKYGASSVMRSCFIASGLKPIAGGVGEEDYQMMSSLL